VVSENPVHLVLLGTQVNLAPVAILVRVVHQVTAENLEPAATQELPVTVEIQGLLGTADNLEHPDIQDSQERLDTVVNPVHLDTQVPAVPPAILDKVVHQDIRDSLELRDIVVRQEQVVIQAIVVLPVLVDILVRVAHRATVVIQVLVDILV